MASNWTEAELQAEAEIEGWSIDVIVKAVNSEAEKEVDDATPDGDGVYAFRTKSGAFGNSAPLWASLPAKNSPYPNDWDSKPVDVNTDYKLLS